MLEKGVSGYVNCSGWILYAFWVETVISQIFVDFLFLPMFVCLFAVVRHKSDNDRSQLLLQNL